MASNDWFDKDFYAVLGVAKDVSAADLKKQYRKLARQFHPDSNPGDAAAEARFKEISEAHAVLADPKQRQEYDAVRAMAGGRPRFAPGGSGGFEDVFGGFGGGPRVQYSQGDFDDLLGGMFGGGGAGGFSGFGGARRPAKGRDITARAALDFTSAVQGDTLKLTVGGKTMTVKIPAGVHDGQKIKLAGKGDASTTGGPPGDLILTVQVRPHPVFTMDGLNLRLDVPVTFAEAALGATIEVPTLGGSPVRLKVAPGTPSGRVLRVKGRGVAGKKGTGDLLASIQVVVPAHLTKEQVEHLEAFVKAGPNESPRADLVAKAKAN
ncbi:molecular chaperone DnaJ [Agrococcus baldri]|uniref:Molecular chaperone DnaJ n=1 Tax=Agrococcus baldri TaxID=153730 RepID=A0AA94HMT7_9MICO|nr:DnaJ C-terminal domain-containing protein [Agrococcus baldri]SFS09214.1 molecular chaperone DnaJ [Agrococcus baldri]